MRHLLLLAVVFAVLPLSGEAVRFDPPAPTTETFVSMRVAGLWSLGCRPANPEVSREGRTVTVRLSVMGECASELPALQSYSVEAPLGLLPAGESTIIVEAWEGSTRFELERTTVYVREALPVVGGSRVEIRPRVVFPGQPHVAIRAEEIAPCPPLVDCAKPIVLFNGVQGTFVARLSDDEVIVRAPMLGPDPEVDVEIRRMEDGTRPAWTVHIEGALRVAPVSDVVDPSLFERILVPVIYNGAGAFGSQWRTEVWLHNLSNAALPRLRTQEQLIGCAPGYCDVPLEARETRKLEIDSAPRGYLMHIARGSGDDLAVNVLFRDLTRQATALGAEMPVVRESEFLTGHSAILNVPTEQKYRITLRGYAFESGTIRFRVSRMDGTPLFESGLLSLYGGDDVTPHHGVIADLMEAFPQLGGMGPFRIEFDGLESSGDDRYWVFASITNNDTQHVTLITPQ